MNEHIKTVGYLLKNYTDSQCYDQYVELRWLKEQIEIKSRQIPLKTSSDWIENKTAEEVLSWLLSILESNG